MSWKPYGFVSNCAPSPFHKFGPPSQEASPQARECVVSECRNTAATPRFLRAPATARHELKWKPEPAT